MFPRLSNHNPSFKKPGKECSRSLTKHGLKSKKCVYKEYNAKGDGAKSEIGGTRSNKECPPGTDGKEKDDLSKHERIKWMVPGLTNHDPGKQKDVFTNAKDVPLLTKFGVLNKKDVFKVDKWMDELDIIKVYAVKEVFQEASGQGGECEDEVQLWLCDTGGSKEVAAARAH